MTAGGEWAVVTPRAPSNDKRVRHSTPGIKAPPSRGQPTMARDGSRSERSHTRHRQQPGRSRGAAGTKGDSDWCLSTRSGRRAPGAQSGGLCDTFLCPARAVGSKQCGNTQLQGNRRLAGRGGNVVLLRQPCLANCFTLAAGLAVGRCCSAGTVVYTEEDTTCTKLDLPRDTFGRYRAGM